MPESPSRRCFAFVISSSSSSSENDVLLVVVMVMVVVERVRTERRVGFLRLKKLGQSNASALDILSASAANNVSTSFILHGF